MQAIITKYLPCTNFKPARMKATCERGSITVSYDHEHNSDGNHIAAADALISKFAREDADRYGTDRNPWLKPRTCGQIPSGEFVHTFANPENEIIVKFASHEDLTYFREYAEHAKKTEGTVTGLKCGIMCSALKRANI